MDTGIGHFKEGGNNICLLQLCLLHKWPCDKSQRETAADATPWT